jgi:ubiquitin carboxyl-terminal hydrolase 7
MDKTNSAFALQRLFYQLQVNKNAVATNELTTAFGWDSKQIFEQQDVQELTRILMERLEEKMKGTEAENALASMFVGKTKTYISCINVDYESSRIEDYWDLQLNVRGCKNLDESFKDYIQVETMDGENKYFAEGYGLQDAKKGVIFESFPSVLHLQLKRFEYDLETFAMTKVNDRHEFPEVFDAAPYLSENADKSEPYIYHLHGVLVHSGDLNAGHYYAFLKPKKNGDFYKFDDDRVTKCLKKEALEENYGGDYGSLANGAQRNPYTRTWSTKRSMNAYMLVYIRESRLDSILSDDEDEVAPPPHLAARFAEERALLEKRRKEREEAHLYQDVQVASLDEFRAHEGFDIINWKADPASPAAPKQYRVLKTKTIEEFKENVGEEFGIEPSMIRFWSMVNRQNQTCRPDQPTLPTDMTIEEAFGRYGNNKSVAFKLWLEAATEKDAEGNPVFGDALIDVSNGAPNNKAILLFIKYFDPVKQTLLGAGHIYAAWQDKVSDLSPQILKLMNWEAGTGFRLYEVRPIPYPKMLVVLTSPQEIKQHMIEAMKPKSTLVASEIQDGDIITVQKTLSERE